MKKVIGLFSLFCILCSVGMAATSGTCGANLTWTLDDNGTLTISGTGDMDDFDFDSISAWLANKGDVIDVIVQSGVTNIGGYAFSGCSNLASINIPNSVTIIGNNAFADCGLTSIEIPSSVESIEDNAFSFCLNLSELTILEGVKSIGNSAFIRCDSLTSIEIPNSVKIIGGRAFAFCRGLLNVSIPDSVDSMVYDAFNYCARMMSIDVSAGNQVYASVNGVLYDKEIKTLLLAPGGITAVKIPDGVTSIGRAAFGESQVKSVIIPKSVTSIGDGAFTFCGRLEDIYYTGTESQWNAISLSDGESIAGYFGDATIHFNYSVSTTPDFTLPSSLSAIGANAFIGTQGYSIRVPDNLSQIDSNAIPSGVTIYAPKGSQSAAWFKGNGYKVVEE